jgi:ABC-2 type transport system permease protein
MTAIRRVWAIATTSLRRFFRDRMSIFLVFVMPLALVLVLGTVFGGGFEPPLGVVAPSGDRFARQLVAELERADDVEVRTFDTADGLRSAVERAVVEGAVFVPHGYGAQMEGGGTAEVRFLARSSGSTGPALREVVEAAVSRQSARVQAARFGVDQGGFPFDVAFDQATALDESTPRITVRTTTLGEALFPDTLGRYDLGASSQLLLFMFISGIASSTLLVQSRQLGVTRRMLSTPTSTTVILVGESLARFATAFVQGVYIMTATWLIFGVDWGDPVGAVAILVAFTLVTTGAGLLAGAIFRNDQQAGSVGVFAGLGLAALGGSMAPLEIFSPLMRDVAHATPHAWGNDAFAELVRRDGSVLDIAPELAVLVAMGVALVALAAWRLRRSITA